MYEDKKIVRVQNLSYDQQKRIQKKLVTQMGDDSENESEAEGDAS